MLCSLLHFTISFLPFSFFHFYIFSAISSFIGVGISFQLCGDISYALCLRNIFWRRKRGQILCTLFVFLQLKTLAALMSQITKNIMWTFQALVCLKFRHTPKIWIVSFDRVWRFMVSFHRLYFYNDFIWYHWVVALAV